MRAQQRWSNNGLVVQALRWTVAAVSLVVLLPVALGIVQTALSIISLSSPLPGVTGAQMNADALQLFHGHSLYQDPSRGYIGSVYTPGMAIAAALLDHITTWTGWVPLIGYLPAAGVAAICGWLTLGPADRRDWIALLQAGGFAAVAWWLMSCLHTRTFADGHVDQPALLLMFLGLALTPRLMDGRRRWFLTVVGLFSLALWSKQVTFTGPAAAVIWLLMPAQAPRGRRLALRLSLYLVGVNGLILALNTALTHGWAFRWLFLFGSTQPDVLSLHHEAVDFLQDHAILLSILAILAVTPLAMSRLRTSRTPHDPARGHLHLLLIFLVIALPVALAARRVQGGNDNDYLPVTWGLLMIGALFIRRARVRQTGQLAFVLACGVVVLIGSSGSLRARLDRHALASASLHQYLRWPSEPSAITAFVATQPTIYDSRGVFWSHDSAGRGYDNFFSVVASLSTGRVPRYLIDGLLDRRFAAVVPFEPGLAGAGSAFAAAQGRYEDNFIWKLNQVIASGYFRAPNAPPGVVVRRPGGPLYPWMRTCFGPFQLGSLQLVITHGGGFWCRSASGVGLVLRRTPAPWSQVQSVRPPGRLDGTIRLSLPRGWAHLVIRLARGPSYRIEASRSSPTSAEMTVLVNGRSIAGVRGEVRVLFGAAGGRCDGVCLPSGARLSALQLQASAGSEAGLEFASA